MNYKQSPLEAERQDAVAIPMPRTFSQWVQDPMWSVVAASVATISTFGFVLGGTWFINSLLY